MNAESEDEIPEKRREAIARRRKAEEAAAAGKKSGGGSATIIEQQAKLDKEAIIARLNARRNAEKTTNDTDPTRDSDLLKEHDKKLEELTARVEELSTSNKDLVEKNKGLEKLLFQVAAQLGIEHSCEVQIMEEKK